MTDLRDPVYDDEVPMESAVDWSNAQADLFEAKEARDEAILRVDDHADEEWKDRALTAVREVARRQPEMIAHDIWRFVERPRVPRATGAVMQRAVREGYIVPTSTHRCIPSKTSHARPVRVWRSLIWRAA